MNYFIFLIESVILRKIGGMGRDFKGLAGLLVEQPGKPKENFVPLDSFIQISLYLEKVFIVNILKHNLVKYCKAL